MTAGEFAFRAVRPNGAVEDGIVAAPTREAAFALVTGNGAFVVSLRPRRPARPQRASAADLPIGLRSLATLLESGLPLSRALSILMDLAPPAWAVVLPEIVTRVERGESLGGALSETRLGLPTEILGIIRAGEAAGALAGAVQNGATLLEERAATRSAIRNALAYPAMLAAAGSVSAGLLIGLVLPRFASLIADANQRLPPLTAFVLAAGGIARVAMVPVVLLGIGGLLWWRHRLRDPVFRRQWHRRLQGVPGIGTIRRSSAAANTCSTLAALLEAGVPVVTALGHSAGAAGDAATEAALALAADRIARGETISAAIAAEGALTPSAVRLIRVGEETARLPVMLAHAGRIESAHAAHRLQALVRVIEPALIIAFGGLVAVVAAALLQAMYSLRPTI